MKRLIICLMAGMCLSSCALFKNKVKSNTATETEIKEQKTVDETEKDTSTVNTYSRITYGGVRNPFFTPQGIKFNQQLTRLTSLNLNAEEMASAVKNLQSLYHEMQDIANKDDHPTIEEKWTNEKKGKSSTKKTEEENNKKEKVKEKEIVTKGIFESIPWYVWLIVTVVFSFTISFFIARKMVRRPLS